MIRPLAVLAVLALGLGSAAAQDLAPPAPADIVVDPAATVSAMPKQANMLTGYYATVAVIELCALSIEPEVFAGMNADKLRLERALSMDAATATEAYGKVKADVEKTSPDCTEGSPDRIGVDAVTAIYKAQPAPTAATGTTTTPAAPAAQ